MTDGFGAIFEAIQPRLLCAIVAHQSCPPIAVMTDGFGAIFKTALLLCAIVATGLKQQLIIFIIIATLLTARHRLFVGLETRLPLLLRSLFEAVGLDTLPCALVSSRLSTSAFGIEPWWPPWPHHQKRGEARGVDCADAPAPESPVHVPALAFVASPAAPAPMSAPARRRRGRCSRVEARGVAPSGQCFWAAATRPLVSSRNCCCTHPSKPSGRWSRFAFAAALTLPSRRPRDAATAATLAGAGRAARRLSTSAFGIEPRWPPWRLHQKRGEARGIDCADAPAPESPVHVPAPAFVASPAAPAPMSAPAPAYVAPRRGGSTAPTPPRPSLLRSCAHGGILFLAVALLALAGSCAARTYHPALQPGGWLGGYSDPDLCWYTTARFEWAQAVAARIGAPPIPTAATLSWPRLFVHIALAAAFSVTLFANAYWSAASAAASTLSFYRSCRLKHTASQVAYYGILASITPISPGPAG